MIRIIARIVCVFMSWMFGSGCQCSELEYSSPSKKPQNYQQSNEPAAMGKSDLCTSSVYWDKRGNLRTREDTPDPAFHVRATDNIRAIFARLRPATWFAPKTTSA